MSAAVAVGTPEPQHEPWEGPFIVDGDAPDYLGTEAPPDELPTIEIRAAELPRIVRETIRALGEGDANLYQRAGQLVRVVREPERREEYETDRRVGTDILTRPGTPRLRGVSTGVLTLRAAMVANWVRFDARKGKGKAGERGGELVPADPCRRTIETIASLEDWPGIRPIRGIIETPCLAPSGRIVQAPGYDDETGYVLLPSCNVGPIDHAPTRQHARAALQYLWIEMACDFPFRGMSEPSTSDPERVLQYAKALGIPDAFVGIASLLTIFARPGVLGAVPGGLFEAAGQGSGKSLQMHTIAMIATSRAAGVATFPVRDGRPNEEELEKILAGYALSGARIIAFDNIRGLLAGGNLEKALTAEDTIDLRVLGSNDQKSMPWPAVMLFSGNNMVMSDDVAQRVLVARIESPREDPRSRPSSTYRHPELLAAVKARRARLVRAALVILRAYLAARDAGEDVPVFSRGSFESWARIVPGAIAWAGGPNVLQAFPEAGRGGDEEGEAFATLLRYWREDWNGQRSSTIVSAIFDGERDKEGPPDGLADVRAAVRSLTKTRERDTPSAHAFGMRLRQFRGKIRDGLRLEMGRDGDSKVSTYSVTRLS